MILTAVRRNGRRVRRSQSITESMARFAEEYVFGAALNTLQEYADLIGVGRTQIYEYLRNEHVREYIRELRLQRLEMIQRATSDKIGIALTEIEQVAKIDAQRIVNKGKKNEFRVYDPALLDRKLRASQQLLDYVDGAKESVTTTEGTAHIGENPSIKDLRIQINNNQTQMQNTLTDTEKDMTLEQIEQLLREKQVLNRGESIKLISDIVDVEVKAESNDNVK